MLQVDPQILRDFASTTSGVADVIDANTLSGILTEAFSGVAGSTSAWAAQTADGFAAELTDKLSAGFDGLASASRGTANNFEVADAAFTTTIDTTFPQ